MDTVSGSLSSPLVFVKGIAALHWILVGQCLMQLRYFVLFLMKRMIVGFGDLQLMLKVSFLCCNPLGCCGNENFLKSWLMRSGDYEAAVENFVAVDIDVAAIETSVLVLREIFVDLWRYDVAAAAVVTSG